MVISFDPEHLRLPESLEPPPDLRPRPSRHRPKNLFLKGPIPWDWLDCAGLLPGKALAVGLVIWQLSGMKCDRTVHVCLSNLVSLGLNKDSARRGIKSLEQAGLVKVRRRPGRGLDVTLLVVRDGGDGTDG